MPWRDRLDPTPGSPFFSEDLDDNPTNDPIVGSADDHDFLTNCSNDESRISLDEEGTAPKLGGISRKNHSSAQNPNYTHKHQRFIVFYQVLCSRKGNHKDHEKSVVYLDHPRLFKGDSKMSALRGREKIADAITYVEQNPKDIDFIVTKTFKCHDYLDLGSVKRLFQQLPVPSDPEIPESIRPYFFNLRTNGPLPCTSYETIQIRSESLQNTLTRVTGISHDELPEAYDARNMSMLQNSIYYYSRLNERTLSALSTEELFHLRDLLEYIKFTSKNDWEEADALVSQGLISQKHIVKLYGPNEILVTTKSGHARAYVLKKSPYPKRVKLEGSTSKNMGPITLNLWSWQFNGLFYKEGEDWSLAWPSSSSADEAIPISQLEIYPLRFASPDVEDRLRTRGRIFWKCRRGRFVAYDSPSAVPEFHTVSFLQNQL